MLDPTLRYDKLKAPFIGHALDELLAERNSKYSWSGSYSFNGQEEYETIKFYDNSVSEAGREIDPRTGDPKNQRSSVFVSFAKKRRNSIIGSGYSYKCKNY